MKLISIEPTPNPNSMKLNLDTSLAKGVSHTYVAADKTADKAADKDEWPDFIAQLMTVPGVKSLFHMADFLAVQRDPRTDWQGILAGVRRAFGEAGEAASGAATAASAPTEPEPDAAFGEVRVEVQMFRRIPMLVKVSVGAEMHREALPGAFTAAVNRAASSSPNMLAERRWVDQGARYGDYKQVAREVAEEVAAAYDEQRLEELVTAAFEPQEVNQPVDQRKRSAKPVLPFPDDADWRVRYAALEQIGPRAEAIAVLLQALQDPKSSIRRLAVVYLGLTGDPGVVPPLCQALEDATVSVRRTAGDALSDLADPRAIAPMTKALTDGNKLVRWRAARFLFETGDASALPALRECQGDAEFEVRMQVRLAIERIEGGHSAQGPVWQQMTRE